jgi:hypothetical protein
MWYYGKTNVAGPHPKISEKRFGQRVFRFIGYKCNDCDSACSVPYYFDKHFWYFIKEFLAAYEQSFLPFELARQTILVRELALVIEFARRCGAMCVNSDGERID